MLRKCRSDGQIGQVYNNLQLAGRMDFPTHLPTSYRFIASMSSLDYFKQERLFTSGNTPVFNKNKEYFLKLQMSMPFLTSQKAEFSIGVGRLEDQYFQTNVIDFVNDNRDQSSYNIFGGSVALEGNTLDSRQFATSGRKERLVANVYTGKEHYKDGVYNEESPMSKYEYTQSWLQISLRTGTLQPIKFAIYLGTIHTLLLFFSQFQPELYGYHDASGNIRPYRPQQNLVQRGFPGKSIYWSRINSYIQAEFCSASKS